MRERILSWLAPSIEDPDLARKQRLLNLVLAGLAAPGFLFGLAMAVMWALGRAPATGAIAGLGVQLFYLLAYWLGRRGRVHLAAYVPVVVLFLVMAGANYQLGIGHVVLIGYAMATLAAGILIGTGAATLFALLSMGAHVAVGRAQIAGGLPSAVSPEATVVADGIGVGLGLIVLVIFNWLSSREIGVALRREQELSAELRAYQATLEQRVAERTADLERRAVQLQAAGEVARDAAAVLDVEELMRTTVERIRERFGFYHAGIFLVDQAAEYAVLRAASSEGGQRMLARGHKLKVGAVGIVGHVASSGQPRIALDVGEDAVFFDNPDLPNTRSEIALPLKVRERVIGVLDVQSVEEASFSDEDVEVLETMADQVALAIENARLLEESQRTLRELQAVYGEYIRTAWEERKAPPAFEYNRVEVTPAPPGFQPDVEQALNADQVVAVTKPEDRQSALVAPLRLRDQVIGAITLEEIDEARPWTKEEIEVVEAVSEQVALALENARLLEETRIRAEELAVLNELGQALTTRLTITEVLEEVYQGASRLLDTANFYVALYDSKADGVSFPLAIEHGQRAQWRSRHMGNGLTEYVIRNRRSLLIQENLPEHLEKMGIAQIGRPALSWLGVPLTVSDRILGVMAIQSDTSPRAYTQHDQDLLTAIASQTAIALQNAHLFEETQRKATQLAAASEVARDTTAILDVNQLLDETVHMISNQFGFYHAGVFLVDERGQHAVLRAASSEGGRRMLQRGHRLEVGRAGIVGYVSATGEPRIALDVGKEAMHVASPDLPETRSEMALPLRARGQVIGVLDVQSTQEAAFAEDDVAVLQTLADQLATAIENARLFEQAQHRARRERLIREITARVRGAADIESILQVTVQELTRALGVSHGLVRLGTETELVTPPSEMNAHSDARD